MIASLAEPAMLMIVFSVALIAGSTQLSTIADYMLHRQVGLRVSLALALVALSSSRWRRTRASRWTIRRPTWN